MEIYVTVYWCDGFGNDSCVGGIYSSLEKAIASISDYDKENPSELRVVKTHTDEDVDFDFYELTYNFKEVYDCFGHRLKEN